MSNLAREKTLLETFAKLADALTDDYDVVDMLQLLVDTSGDLFEGVAAGILLADSHGELEVIASTSEASRLVETLQLSAQAGPCIESFRTGRIVSIANIAESPPHWSAFKEGALEQGFASAHAVPMSLRDATIGTLNLLGSDVGELDATDITAVKALADVATIGILHERSVRESTLLAEQLQTALNRRTVIEQAKGVVAHTQGVSVEEAFDLIRKYARAHQLSVGHVASGLVDLTLSLDDKKSATP